MAGEETFDVVVIGAGPGGYVCAIRAAQLGLKAACVDARPAPGGTCLNVGCIPSKALLSASARFHEAGHGLAAFGVKVGAPKLDLAGMMGHKDRVVADNTKGVGFLFRKNGVEHVVGTARIVSAPGTETGAVEVALAAGGTRTLAARAIVVATGSDPVAIPGIAVDEERVVTSTGALALAKVPKHLVVIGAGYIGLELGSVWQRLGAAVTVVEVLDRITPGMDAEVARAFQRALEKQGIKFRLGTRVAGVEATKAKLAVTLAPAAGGDGETLDADVVLVAVGRRPVTEGLGLDELGVARDRRGFVAVDGSYQTSVEGIFAIGDVIPGPMLAHKASEEGVALAEILAGEHGHVDYGVIPAVVYTEPEVASVGRTEEELKADKVAYKVGKFPFTANGRARANNATEGFVKLLADTKTDRLLGAHIIGADAGTLIHEIVVAMAFGGSAEDVARICHAHPTLSEAVHEAALAAGGAPLHI
ncbi:MAG: dihydrolipoyl dehydrogenase [Alphaproteobacteria bacterium]